eukprot:TRINITY_DN6606_c0_g1_i1.p1 TRINITY_DN6606_c0_g1~~TRINITY_DN6606_c0_g1_i1.p1  ORF type:complete len:471 (-),score=132.19 TRINITY_DN6606_c0_g1_i1:39-1451(-)
MESPFQQGLPWDGKSINDPIHGEYIIPNYAVEFIDTPQFQRLRDLKALGLTYYVFPGATHNRFEHCLGVGEVARLMISTLRSHQRELDIQDRDVKCVYLAGACHDLGHGPFSHAFEEWIHARTGGGWHHEDMSKTMFDYMVDDNQIDISKEDSNLVKELISGKNRGAQRNEKKFLFDIVANMRNSIDVDKFDYLARDSYATIKCNSFDYKRLIGRCRVINDEICFYSKEAYGVYELFHIRYSMHKRVYSHPVTKAIEYMISDALTLADEVLEGGISEKVHDPARYLHLSDSVVKSIEWSDDIKMKPAQDILRRVAKRDLYKFVDQILISGPEMESNFSKATSEDIFQDRIVQDILNFDQTKQLRAKDIIVNNLVLNYAMKDKNPVDNTSFFNKANVNYSFKVSAEEVSKLTPPVFNERYLRVFTRDSTKSKDVQNAFMGFLRSRNIKPSPLNSKSIDFARESTVLLNYDE